MRNGLEPPGGLNTALLAVGFWLGIVSGVVLAATYVVEIPELIVLLGWLGFFTGMLGRLRIWGS